MWLLTSIIFLPSVGALLLLLVPAESKTLIRWWSTLIAAAAFVLSLSLYALSHGNFGDITHLQFIENRPWIDVTIGTFDFKIRYLLGVDGLSIPMVILNGLLSLLAIVSSWHIEKRTREYMILLLLLETGVMGVFAAADLFLFFLFWEVELIPMFLLIGIWGGQRREYAAWKFLLYTLAGSSIMLAGILLLYFNLGAQTHFYTADMRYIATHALAGQVSLGSITISLQLLTFLMIFFAFAVKIPMFPFHTWLPDAHTEAPTAVSVLLAGVLLKMGAYGLIRLIGFLPEGAQAFAGVLGAIAVINILYGACISTIQSDMKKMIAYSSVSHMGIVLLGVAAATGPGVISQFKMAALTGAALQMFTHGTITGLLFLSVGIIYDRAHTREISVFSGLAKVMPVEATIFSIAAFASLGLPMMSGFVAEYLVFTGSYSTWQVYTILGSFGIVLTAGYLLWLLKRVFYGPLNQAWIALPDTGVLYEIVPLAALVVVILFVGIWPGPMVDLFRGSVGQILTTVVPLH